MHDSKRLGGAVMNERLMHLRTREHRVKEYQSTASLYTNPRPMRYPMNGFMISSSPLPNEQLGGASI